MERFLFIILGLIFFFTPYERGLFFDQDFYLFESLIMVCLLVYLIYSFWKKNIISTWTYFLVFLIPAMFVISFIHAESPKGNFDNLFRWLSYASLFVSLVYLRRDKLVEKLIMVLFQLTGFGISIFSWCGFLGWIDYNDVVLGDRLSGPFQYPNTFGAVMGAYWLYSLIMITKNEQSKWHQWLYAFPVVIFSASLLLSYSRGAFVAIAFAWFIGLLLLKFKNQIVYLIYSLISILFSCVIVGLSMSFDGNKFFVALALVLSSFLMLLISSFLIKSRFYNKLSDTASKGFASKYGRITLIIIMIVISVILVMDVLNQGIVYQTLPGTLQEKLRDINLSTGSVLGRSEMYGDALKIIQDHMLIGVGGEGWKILYPIYQSSPYYSGEIHNGYLELVLDIGILGFLVFLSVLAIFIASLFIKRNNVEESIDVFCVACISALSMLFLHGFLDFNFSFGTVWLIVFWLLAMSVPNNLKMPIISKHFNYRVRLWIPIFLRFSLIIFIGFGLVYSIRFFASAHESLSLQKQISMGNSNISLEKAVQVYESVYSKNPYDTSNSIYLSGFYSRQYVAGRDEKVKQKAIDVLEKAEWLEPKNARVLFKIGQTYGQLSEWDKAIELMNKALKYEKYNVQYYNTVIPLKVQLAQQLISAGASDESKGYINSAIDNYELYLDWYKQFKDQYIVDSRELRIERQTHLAAARAYLLAEKLEDAYEILKLLSSNFEPGIYDQESGKLIVDEFDFISMEEVVKNYAGQIMIFSVKGEAVAKLPNDLKELLEGEGLNVKELKEGGSYIGVISNNQAVNNIVNNEGDITLNETTSENLKELFGDQSFTIYSAGENFGNESSININGKEYSLNSNGFNIAVFDSNFHHLGSFSFDTHHSDINVYHPK